MVGAVAALLAAYIGYRTSVTTLTRLDREKEQRKLALDILTKLLTEEYPIKSRLTIQSYLSPDGAKNGIFGGKRLNFHGIDKSLSAFDDKDHYEARFYIRAIPNFFCLVEVEPAKGLPRLVRPVVSKRFKACQRDSPVETVGFRVLTP